MLDCLVALAPMHVRTISHCVESTDVRTDLLPATTPLSGRYGKSRNPFAYLHRHDARSALPSRQTLFLLAVGALVGTLASALLRAQLGPPLVDLAAVMQRAAAPTLVIYAFSAADSLSRDNMLFFVREAVRPGDRVRYMFLLKTDPTDDITIKLPQLPDNAEYVEHGGACDEWGTYAWALSGREGVDIKDYNYFIFLSSSVRGPFLHPSLAGHLHWTRHFTQMIDQTTKLVGPAISCQTVCRHSNIPTTCRTLPFVQSSAVATDQEGLAALRASTRVLDCHSNPSAAAYDGEVGASEAVINAGFNIGSFLVRYRQIDFRRPENVVCNRGSSPLTEHALDGHTASVMELIFPEVQEATRERNPATHDEALKLSEWVLTEPMARDVRSNDAVRANTWQKLEDGLLESAVLAAARGIDCFDFEYYLSKNPDIKAAIPDRAAVFRHFLAMGLQEARDHHWLCGVNRTTAIPTWP